jgi:hypothetical protein
MSSGEINFSPAMRLPSISFELASTIGRFLDRDGGGGSGSVSTAGA